MSLNSVQTLYDSSDGRVYGNIGLTYEGNNQFSISSDGYDFGPHDYKGSFSDKAKTFTRNRLTEVGKLAAGSGKAFPIHFSGLNTVK